MRFNKTGPVGKNLYVAGNEGVPVYLLGGETPVLFDAGNACLAGLYIRDILEILGGRPPQYLFITHSHFDHIGAAWKFKETWPDLKIVASEKTAGILQRPHAIELMKKLNREAAREIRKAGIEAEDIDFEPFGIGQTVTGGECFDLPGGITVQVLAAPGHTWDFLSYHVPQKKILIASEAVGVDNGAGHIFTEFLVDFDAYLDSLKTLKGLKPDILCPGHRYVLTGEDAAEHLKKAPALALDYLDMVMESLNLADGDVEKAALRVKTLEWDPEPWPKQPESAYWLNTLARVRAVSERMSRCGVRRASGL